jgi:hypothetical protein
MAGFGYVCAVVLAAVFVRAGVAKAVRPQGTVAGFVALGVPGAPVVARAVPAVEIALAVALLSFPRIGGVGAVVTLGAFSVFLARAVRAGVTAGCNCFGQARTEPVSGHDLVRNAMLAALAAAALSASRPVVPSLVATVAAVAIVLAGVVVLRAKSNR